MIAYIKGKITHKDPTHVIIDVQGVGYEIRIPLSTYSHIKDKDEGMLHTYLHVKEDAHTLFGFHSKSEKKVFMDLISISGVGPSTGLMIQSSLSAEELQQAIVNEDVVTIQNIKGIGAKTAQRLILELKDKMKREGVELKTPEIDMHQHNTLRQEALSALTTLGFTKSMAEKNINAVLRQKGTEITLEELIKLALKSA